MKMKRMLNLLGVIFLSAFSVQSWAQATETITLTSSKDHQLRKGNTNQDPEWATLEFRNNGSDRYAFCGLLGFDFTEIRNKIAEGYKVQDLKIVLTNATKNCDDKLSLQPFGHDWENAKSTTWSSMETRINEAVSESALATVELPNQGEKPFQLGWNTNKAYPNMAKYDVAGFQGTLQSDALTTYVKNALAGSDSGVSFLIVNTKESGNGEMSIFTNNAISDKYGTSKTDEYKWNEESNKWEDTGVDVLRYTQILTYFGMTEEQFKAAVAPKLVVTLEETGVKVADVLPVKMDVSSANIVRTGSAETKMFVDNMGNETEGYYTVAVNGSIYLGRYDFKSVQSIKVNLSMCQSSQKIVSVNLSTMDAIEGEVTSEYFNTYDVRSGNVTFCNLRGTQTIDGSELWANNKFKRGVDYVVDMVNKTITIDSEGFKEYWKEVGEAVATEYSIQNKDESKMQASGFGSGYNKTVSSDKLQDFFMYGTGQNGRIGVSEVTLYFRDNSSVTVPVKAMNGYEITEKNMSAALIQASSEVNGDPITSVTLGDVALTADNAALLAELKAAGINATAETASYDLTVKDHGNATLCLPFAAALPDGVEAYTLNYTSGDKAQATPVDELAANTPVFIKAAQGTYTFETANASIEMADEPVAGALVGGYTSKYVPAGAYVFQNQTAGAAFYKVASDNTFNFKPFRAYLQAETAGANALFIDWGEVTGVDATVAETVETDGPVYTLQGVKVADSLKDAKLARGLYIVNGKTKVIR